jgi:hypothetical protein
MGRRTTDRNQEYGQRSADAPSSEPAEVVVLERQGQVGELGPGQVGEPPHSGCAAPYLSYFDPAVTTCNNLFARFDDEPET